MQAYVTNKILSFGAVIAFIGITFLLYGFTPTQWQLVLLAIVIFGYAHYFIGFYYQLRGLSRSPAPRQRYLSFTVLLLLSLIVGIFITSYLGFVLQFFLGFLYFLLHGLFNEQTLIEKQTGIKTPLAHLCALVAFIIALLTYSIPDKTLFFNENFQFIPVDQFTLSILFNSYYLKLQYFPWIFWVTTGFSFALLAWSWHRSQHTKAAITISIILGLSTILVALFGAPPYIYMHLFVVGYHFITWLIFYLVEMRRRGRSTFIHFASLNIGLVAFLCVLAYFHFSGHITHLSSVIFNHKTFVIMTYIHITTSFMNDDWFKKLEAKIYRTK